MVFSSLTFLFLFLPISMAVYYISPWKAKNFMLFLFGILFYMWGEPVYILVMMASILVDYTMGILMNKYDYSPKIRKLCLLGSIVMNLGMLGYFKYSNFVLDTANSLFGISLPMRSLILPIGISFYTFQSMSYTIDLYRRKIPVQKNFIKFGAFVSMYPQLVAGPIVLYDHVRRELEDREINMDNISEGISIFIRGLAKKVLLANNIGALWVVIKAIPMEEMNAILAWMGILAFAFQIFFDFSGYSEMAIGMGKMLGFNFPQNFNFPYMAKSISEFWRRWHMTLGAWFREYLYIPLGGNRKGTGRTLVNLMVVWGLTGLWHGASWNFVVWGLYFGVLIVLERLFLGDLLKKVPAIVSRLYTFLMVLFGWVMFEFDKLGDVGHYLQVMFGVNGGGLLDGRAWYYLRSYSLVFLLCVILSTDVIKRLYGWLREKLPPLLTVVNPVLRIALFVLCIAYLVDATYNPFLYFRF